MGSVDCEKKFGFVILHYMAFDMTVKCVSNLLQRFGKYNIEIVIVDNASNNGSGSKLEEKYVSEEMVTVLLNKKNDGFAKGNNLGYKYLVENNCPDYIVVMNNDVLIEQDDFLYLIDKTYLKERFAVLGPDIYCPAKNKHQNPAHIRGFSIEEVGALYNKINGYSLHPAYHYYKHATLGKIKRRVMGDKQHREQIEWEKAQVNVVLHGACYVFSQDFITRREYCFNPGTFLYMEEDILHYECMRKGLKMIYSPALKVKHLEDVSTNASTKSEYKKFIMKNSEMEKSIKIMLKIMREEQM